MNVDALTFGRSKEIERAAAQWVARRDRGLTAAEQDEFSLWLAADARHGEALAEQHWNWDELDRLAGLQIAVGAAADPDLLAPGGRMGSRAWRWIVPVTLAAAASVGLALWLPRPTPAVAVAPAMLGVPGERQRLEDGSVVDLSEEAQIAVAFSAGERRVTLKQGEAIFSVARDRARPFVVHVDGIEVRAVGTIFSVRVDPDVVEVGVIEGRVAIQRSTAKGMAAGNGGALVEVETMAVAAGQRAQVSRMGSSGPAPKVTTLTTAQLAARGTGQAQGQILEFHDTPLAEVVAALNRHNRVQMVLGDAEIGKMLVGGKFSANDVAGFVRLLEATMDVRAERRGDWEVVLRKKK